MAKSTKGIFGNLLGYIIMLPLLIGIMFFQKACAKFKFRNYDLEMTSFVVEDKKYKLCVSDPVGGETLDITTYSQNNEVINNRAIGLTSQNCYSFRIPSVNNPLTYSTEKWNLFQNLTTKDISNVRWSVRAEKIPRQLDSGIFQIEK